MTYSIVARDPETGTFGVAVASCYFAAGAIAPYIGPRAAISTQSYVNPIYGTEGLARVSRGEDPNDVLADLTGRDEGRAVRQCHMIDAKGRIAQFTGAECLHWAGHRAADNVSAAGNILAGPAVVDDMITAYQDNLARPLAERLLAAMDAAEAAGGDIRGRQSAGLVIANGEDWRWLDLRVDDHALPLEELRRLYDVAGEEYLKTVEKLPTREDFSRVSNDDEVSAENAANPKPSRSHIWKRPEA